ncbi:MAG: cytochrome P450, partial [Gammaproteobacteria bacterium]|nr:cytochrome P450 [Gammaproteobacteria bacterium]
MTVEVLTESPELDDGLVDTRNWGDEEWVHRQFAWLRAHDPVRRMEPDGFDPYWSLSRHADIKAVESDSGLFINDPRPILGPRMMDALVQAVLGRRHLVRSLVQMDDPDHARYRALTQQWFRGENLRRLSGRIDELAAHYVDRLGELGGECDFLKDIAMWYPLRVIMSILGVPESDEPLMLKLTQEMFGSSDPDVRPSIAPGAQVDVIRGVEADFSEL